MFLTNFFVIFFKSHSDVLQFCIFQQLALTLMMLLLWALSTVHLARTNLMPRINHFYALRGESRRKERRSLWNKKSSQLQTSSSVLKMHSEVVFYGSRWVMKRCWYHKTSNSEGKSKEGWRRFIISEKAARRLGSLTGKPSQWHKRH